MMSKFNSVVYLLVIFSLFSFKTIGQTKVSGKVTDDTKQSIPGANVYIKDTYDGVSSDADGRFSFIINEGGEAVLVVSFLGYHTFEQKISLNGSELILNPVLKASTTSLNPVTVSAGTFEASDEKKAVLLRPLDIVTTAGASGDIYGALQTLPGAQQVGEQEGLFIRGGSATETKTIIDGMIVQHPYYSSVPDISQRGRFSPFLFKGTIFSTGGYSAEYGQAMSSALVLETEDLPDNTTTNLGIMSVGLSGGHNHRWKKTSLGFDASYINLSPAYSINNQRVEWEKVPESGGGSMIFRQKTSKTGLLKMYTYYNGSHLATFSDNLDSPGIKDRYELKNGNVYVNTSYKEVLSKNWSLYSGLSYSNNKDDVKLNSNSFLGQDYTAQARVKVTRQLGSLSSLKIGGESFRMKINNENKTYMLKRKLDEINTAGFAEADIFFGPKIVTRIGVRYEWSQILQKNNFAPRASLAYKTGKDSQISFAYGDYYQTPESMYLWTTNTVGFEKAAHYILNYQHVSEKRTFRVETYYKDYVKLLKVIPDTSNFGKGYAKGFEVFWRDKQTIPSIDYWVSYSYLDTKRDYRDFPILTTPNFASTHTVTFVYKQYITKLNSNIGATYLFSSGRPYYNPNNSVFLGDRVPAYHNLSLNLSYLTMIKDNFTVIALSFSNILGIDNIYSYRYSSDGSRNQAVKAPELRSFFIGIFMNIGRDTFDM